MADDGNGRHSVVRRDVHNAPVATDSYNNVVLHGRVRQNPVDSMAIDHHHETATAEGKTSGEIKFHVVEKNDEAAEGIERIFSDVPIPPWKEQITVRALVVAAILGTGFSVIVHRPFTRQENTVIQTCVVSCYGIAFTGGFGSYLLGMSNFAYEIVGPERADSTVQDIKNPSLGWIYAFIFTVSLSGIFVLVPLRKIMIIDYKLIYPSGTATAMLINSFHTPFGAKLAKKQVKYLGKYFSLNFAWSFFKWFFSGIGNACGFDSYPTLGPEASKNTFYFNFSMTFLGAGMICPHRVNCSVLFGAIISWGLMWPLIRNREEDWYPAGLNENRDFRGLYGYKIFIPIALIVGDGLYNFAKMTFISLSGLYIHHNNRQQQLPMIAVGKNEKGEEEEEDMMSFDEKRRTEVFLKGTVPYWLALTGYGTLAILSVIVIPQIFTAVKWYYVLVAYIVAPLFAFCNAYGTGLTDWNLASAYGKLVLFCFAAWAGSGGGGILVGLVACGIMISIAAIGGALMQDFRTGYMTLSSPRSMLTAQLIEGVLGCVVSPATFWLFWTAFDIGDPKGTYKAPFAVLYRTMALIGIEGFGSLPRHCLQLCAAWFVFAVAANAIRDSSAPKTNSRFIPIPMAMAIPFYIGAYFAIDMFIGTCIVFFWQRTNRKKADAYSTAIAASQFRKS